MHTENNDIQAGVAKFITDLRYESLPPEIIADTKYRILDWLGSALAGVSYQPSILITEFVKSIGGEPRSTILKGGAKVSVPQAALANGVIGHAAEVDDGHRKAIAHPGAVTVPTALAATEGYGKSGKAAITSIVAGYEVLIRLGMAINPSHYKIWHATGTCGVFAAAAVASSLLRLDAATTQMALGIAGTMASGLQETFGTHAKPLNAGHACQSGIQAALLAQRGFSGPKDILMGDKGFIRATASEYDIQVLQEIGNTPLLTNTAFYKVYASCGHTNSPLDVMFKMMERYEIPLTEIRQIEVQTYRIAVDLTGKLKNINEDQAKFSLPYCLAAALIYKRVTLQEFTSDNLNNPAILEIARKIKVSEDLQATALFPKRRATIRIELKDGRILEEGVDNSNDTPNYAVIEEKYFGLSETCLDRASANKIRDMVLNMDQLDDCSQLMKYLA